MITTIIEDLASIRDHLDEEGEFVCAAHIQMAIDTLSTRKQEQHQLVEPELNPI